MLPPTIFGHPGGSGSEERLQDGGAEKITPRGFVITEASTATVQ